MPIAARISDPSNKKALLAGVSFDSRRTEDREILQDTISIVPQQQVLFPYVVKVVITCWVVDKRDFGGAATKWQCATDGSAVWPGALRRVKPTHNAEQGRRHRAFNDEHGTCRVLFQLFFTDSVRGLQPISLVMTAVLGGEDAMQDTEGDD